MLMSISLTAAVSVKKDEVIELRHTSYSRAIFAKGAVEAAKFLKGKPAGIYDMQQVVAE